MPLTGAERLYVVGDDARREPPAPRVGAGWPWQVQCFSDPERWLEAAPELAPGCVVLNLRGPCSRDCAVLERMKSRAADHTAIVLTSHGGIAATVAAMKAGAVDVLEQPASLERLAQSIRTAFDQLRARTRVSRRRHEATALLDRLSPREREVMLGVIEGLPNKLIAFRLGLSTRTVEVHRASLMTKMELTSAVDLLRCAWAAGLLEA